VGGNGDGRRPTKRSDTRFYRLGLFASRRRWLILIAWVALLVAAMPFVGKLTTRLSSGGFEVPGSQSDQVAQTVKRDFPQRTEFSSLLVVHSDDLTAQDSDFRDVVETARDNLLKAPGVSAVVDPFASQASSRLISKDGHTVIAEVNLSDDQDQALKHNDELEAAVAEARQGATGIQAELTGPAPFYSAFQDTTTHYL